MRVNKFIATHTEYSRRMADNLVSAGRVEINGTTASLGDTVIDSDTVNIDGHPINKVDIYLTGILHKPAGFVVSKNGQGSKTIYDLLPIKYHRLNPVGRLDKDSSGLLLMTNNGDLAQQLSHPKYDKSKVYDIELNKTLSESELKIINSKGVDIGDQRLSKFSIESTSRYHAFYRATLKEGRNRQIRRTFEVLGYKVIRLHRVSFGPYKLGRIAEGKFTIVD